MMLQPDRTEDLCPLVTIKAMGPRYSTAQIVAALPQATPKATEAAVAIGPEHMSQIALSEKIMAQTHQELWAGQWSTKYKSQSDADLALSGHIARHLAKVGVRDAILPTMVEAIFGRSALAQRCKWQSRSDYRGSTIGKACGGIEATVPKVITSATVARSDHGDIRNARFFGDMWRDRLVFVHGRKQWLEWRDGRWRQCDQGEEFTSAKEACRALFAAAGEVLAVEPEKAQRLVQDAARAAMLPRIKAMLELAQSEPGMSVASDQLDANPYLLGVSNGVVDLRTGTLRSNEPDLYITRYCNADFNRDALCSRWLKFLDEVFQGDQETIKSVQLLLGCTLIGKSTEEIIVFCVGFGANGKSIFGNVVAEILGDYAKTAPSSMLGTRRAGDHAPRNDLAMLDGARLVSINELPAGMQLDENLVKQLAGREPISARFLNQEFFTYQPRFTPWVRTNHKPIIKGDDDGIWRRVVVLPFRRRFEEPEQDRTLETKLLAERDGILSWMVEGAQLYLMSGMRLSPAISAERATYRKESDLLGEFLEEHAVAQPGSRVEQSVLYCSWGLWCSGNGAQPGSKKSFTQRLAERGFEASKSNGKHYYQGLHTAPSPLFCAGQEGQD